MSFAMTMAILSLVFALGSVIVTAWSIWGSERPKHAVRPRSGESTGVGRKEKSPGGATPGETARKIVLNAETAEDILARRERAMHSTQEGQPLDQAQQLRSQAAELRHQAQQLRSQAAELQRRAQRHDE